MVRASLAWLVAVELLATWSARPAGPVSAAVRLPAWLKAGPDTVARVDVGPWVTPDEPEAALTLSRASAERDYSADTGRPGDVLYEPIGVRVRMLRVLPGDRVALVHGIGARWQAYASLDRLVPEVPRGTALTVAGGFGGFADLFTRLSKTNRAPVRLATGTRLTALETAVAPYEPGNSDFVGLQVRVMSGSLRGRTGWIAVAYTGLPVMRVASGAGVAANACSCLLIQFDVEQP